LFIASSKDDRWVRARSAELRRGEWLRRGANWVLRELKVNPIFDGLRFDQRYARLLKQLHFE
jgi:hypothetical protein